MLFNSFQFIFLFLPVVFAGLFLIGRYSHKMAALWLGVMSLLFYAVWNFNFVFLLLASICFNYVAGVLIATNLSRQRSKKAKKLFIFSIVFNLTLLGYFKYSNFFIDSLNTLFEEPLTNLSVILPLGISFFTFTQIAYLVDVHRGIAREYNFIHYLLFVTYFPHLIAGPVLHHKQMMPQFSLPETYRINLNNVAAGLSIFILGLTKKVLIADNLSEYATPIFAAAEAGAPLMFFESWIGALSYTMQLYFDFSAYCDMAIGLSLMLNVRLPMNFNSPYKSTNIIDFWRRWHMTLSAFLRDYLYIPLGGNRKGKTRRYINLMITMLLGGLWHGAGWTFVIWGGLHGVYLMINHGWHELRRRLGWEGGKRTTRFLAGCTTFIAIVIGWVFFRAETFSGAWTMLTGMSGLNGISLPAQLHPEASQFASVVFDGLMRSTHLGTDKIALLIVSLWMVWYLPNIRELFARFNPTWEDTSGTLPVEQQHGRFRKLLVWNGRASTAWAYGILFVVCIFSLTKVSEFLYFQF